jgi:hypothetical protein
LNKAPQKSAKKSPAETGLRGVDGGACPSRRRS